MDSFYCDGNNYIAEKNQLVFINPGEVHTGSTVSNTPLQYYSLYPDKKTLQHVAASLHISLPENFSFQRSLIDQSSLTEKFRLLFNSFRSNETLQQQELFFDCMQELLQPSGGNKHSLLSADQRDSRVQLVIDFIRCYFKEDISLQQLSDIVRLNPFHLVRLFKKSVGVSPYDYFLIIRTEYARQLLRKGFKVQEAARESGFYDASHFNRMFSKIAGTSPKSFRLSKSQYCTNFTAG